MSQKINKHSDKKLRAAILIRFKQDRCIDIANLRVGVLNGIVHLAGEVDSLDTWNMATELVCTVPGVRGVVNRIEAPGAPSPARTINLDLSSDENEE